MKVRQPVTDQEVEMGLSLLRQAIASDKSTYSMRHALSEIAAGAKRLYVATSDGRVVGAFTISVFEAFGELVAECDNLAGADMPEWLDEALLALCAEAETHGATVLRGRGRWGWDRYARERGFERDYAVWRRPYGRK